ncbi:MAG: hypothetical protein PWQ31_787 [Eubacteriales bacterium]|nr:hypothetical protein [Eubacteriales bacterium]
MFERNREYFQKRGFQVEWKKINQLPSYQVEVFPARKEGLSFAVEKDGRRVSFHSVFDPVEEARKLVMKADLSSETDLLLVYGLGMGYHLPFLRERVGPATGIIVVEPDPRLLGVLMQHRDYSSLFDSRTWLVAVEDDEEVLNEIKKHFAVGQRDRIAFFEQPVYGREFASYFTNVTAKIRDYVSNVVGGVATVLSFEETWLSNYLCNLEYFYLSPGVIKLTEKFKGVPAIVVSAGPSLDKNLSHLREVQGRGLIISVGAALKALQREEITPDFVVTIDGSEKNYSHFSGANYSPSILVFDPATYPRVVREHEGIKFTFTSLDETAKWIESHLDQKGTFLSGGSVAHAALQLALLLGADPVILVGQDLAFTDGRRHTSSYALKEEENTVPVEGEEGSIYYVRVPGYYGGEVWTSRALYNFLRWFEEYIENCARDRTIINATEGGARIEGTVQMPLREVIAKYCQQEVRVREVVEKCWWEYVPPSPQPLVEALLEVSARLGKIARTCREGEETADRLIRLLARMPVGAGPVQELLKKLDRIDGKLKREEATLHFLNEAVQRTILQTMYRCRELPQDESRRLVETVKLSREIYRRLGETASRFRVEFKEAAARLSSRKGGEKGESLCQQ